jgi:predicted SAM-dependent methyltransferase
MNLSYEKMLGRMRHKIIAWKIQIRAIRKPLKIVIGAGGIYNPGWLATDIEHLNILVQEDWNKYFKANSIDAILAEHVWEHLTLDEAYLAAKNCYYYLKSSGYIRVAVPDGLHVSLKYINSVKPGGSGLGSDDHKVLYNYKTLSNVFKSAGFSVKLLEYFDEQGIFHQTEWNPENGLIQRSSKYDERNKEGQLNYTSIIIDATKEEREG